MVLHGDDHPNIAAALGAVEQFSHAPGHLTQAWQYFDEFLRMNRSMYGDKDDHDIAAAVYWLETSSKASSTLMRHLFLTSLFMYFCTDICIYIYGVKLPTASIGIRPSHKFLQITLLRKEKLPHALSPREWKIAKWTHKQLSCIP